jgi:hypothetical protein
MLRPGRPVSAVAAAFCLVLSFGCSSEPSSTTPDAGATADAGPTPDAGVAPDAGTASCTGPCRPGSTGASDCVCTFNEECSAGFRCGAVDNGTCECGARGTGAVSAPCTSPNDCASAICLDTNAGGSFCTVPCMVNGDCSGTLNVCNPGLGLCADR